jgi:MFS family permease
LKKQRLYYGWVVLAASLIFGVIAYGTRYSYGIFFKSLEQDFGWSRALTSSVFSGYMILGSIFAIPGGWASDRYGPRIVAIFMGLFTSLSLLLTSYANSLWHVFISYSLLLAIGTGPTYVVTTATASRWFVKRRGLAVGIVGSGLGSGILVMTPIAAYLVSSFDWQTAYFIMAFVALFTMVPCALPLRKAPTELAALPDGEKLTVATLPREQPQNELESFSLLQAAKTKNFWLILFVWLLFSFCMHLVLTHLVPHATDLGIAPMKAATILTLLGGMSIAGNVVMGRLSDTIGRKQAATLSALLMAGAMLLLVGASNLWLLYLFGIIFGFAYGGFAPPITVLIGEVFGLRNFGLIMGVLVIGWGLGAALGPFLAGYIFDISGNYVYAFLIGVVAMLTAAGLIFSVTRPRR